MSAPGATGRRPVVVRLAAIGLLTAGVTAALYVIGRLHTPNFTASLFGRSGLDAIALKSVLATVALGLAVLQVLLARWIYRKLPLAGSHRVRRDWRRVIGFGLFVLTVPIAVHCLLAYGVQLTSLRVAVHSIAGCFFYGAFAVVDLAGPGQIRPAVEQVHASWAASTSGSTPPAPKLPPPSSTSTWPAGTAS